MSRNHKSAPQFHVLCGIDGCARTYKRFFSYRNHITNKHRAHLICQDTVDAAGDQVGDFEENVNLNQSLGDDKDDNNDPEADISQQQQQFQKRDVFHRP